MDALWFFRTVLLLVCSQSIYGCQQCPSLSGGEPGYTEVTYAPTDAQVINPECGGAIVAISFASNPTDLSEQTLTNYRQTDHINIIWRIWYLDTFLTSPISTNFLNHIKSDFDVLRATGFKATFRFAYTDNQTAATKEADLPQMLAHIAQLKPIFQEYEDVILSVQAGFIGVWGEWYYSTYFGDAGVVSDSDWEKRKTVVAALLDAVPVSRTLHIRTPAFKRAITGSDSPLTSSDYRNRNNNGSRIGHHNDCFLASSTDFGTYGNVAVDYPYLKQDTKFTSMGGETCNENPPRSECTTAKEEMAMFHWTFLNLAYKVEVINGWKSEGCYEEIRSKLGYRLSLVRSVLPNSVASGADACFIIEFKNEGYAPPINPRHVRLVLIGSAGKYTSPHITAFSNVEPWLPEDGTISVHFSLRMSVAEGKYDVMLELNDPLKYGNPEYNVLLVNKGVGDIRVGLNNLLHKIQVVGVSNQGSCDQFSERQALNVSDRLRCYSDCADLQVTENQLPNVTSVCTNNLIKNAGLEKKKKFTKRGKLRLVRDPRYVFHGSKAFKLSCGDNSEFYQKICFNAEDNVKCLLASLWSKVKATNQRSGTYSLRVDLKFSDGSTKMDINSPFNATVTGWQRQVVDISEVKSIVEVKVRAICNMEKLTAFFDEMALMLAPASCQL